VLATTIMHGCARCSSLVARRMGSACASVAFFALRLLSASPYAARASGPSTQMRQGFVMRWFGASVAISAGQSGDGLRLVICGWRWPIARVTFDRCLPAPPFPMGQSSLPQL
jgi:hypothetical protein